MATITDKLKQYVFRLQQVTANVDKVVELEIPKGKVLQISQVVALFDNDWAVLTEATNLCITMSLRQRWRSGVVPSNDAFGLIQEFQMTRRFSDSSGTWFVPNPPMVWNPPKGMYVGGRFMVGTLHVEGAGGAVRDGTLRVYGTLHDLTDLDATRFAADLRTT